MLTNDPDTTGKVSAGSTMKGDETPSSPIRIWVVDDNDGLRAELVGMLGRLPGVTCLRDFDSPNSVLSTLASKPGPDVILLDIQMGDLNGLDAVRPIRSLSRSTRVLMFTSFFDHAAYQRAMAEGASGYLVKYDSLEDILANIRRAWAEPAPVVRRRAKRSPARTDRAETGRLQSKDRPNAGQRAVRRFLDRCLGLFQGGRN